MLVSETKIDGRSPQDQSITDGFSAPYRLDYNYFDVGLMLFVREYIPSNLLKIEENQ